MENNSEVELNKLVSMAEEVSERVTMLNVALSKSRLILITSSVLTYLSLGLVFTMALDWKSFSALSMNYSIIAIAVIIAVCSMLYAVKSFKELKNNRQILEIEKEILKRLLEMVYEYKEHLHNSEFSFVDNAILEMKLKRMKFSGQK